MIIREATIKYAGYDPDDLKPKSNKRVCCSCDGCGRVRWTRKADHYSLCRDCLNTLLEYRKLQSDLQIGDKSNNWVDLPDEEICQKYLDGKHSPELTKEYNTTVAIILNHLHTNNIEVRKKRGGEYLYHLKRHEKKCHYLKLDV